MTTFKVYPIWNIEPVRAEGAKIYDKNNQEYLDLYGGHAVISIGHSHPHYIESIKNQLDKIGFYSNSVENSLQEKLADKLAEISSYPDYSLFLCNSGAEANENAIKLASFHTGKKKVLAFKKSFHGRTSGAVAITDNPSICSPFNESQNVCFAELDDITKVEVELKSNEYAAVIIEGIQGVAGIYSPTTEFMQKLRELCTANNVILILDEVQSGYGRTGKFFAHQHYNIKADIISMAKGMGNGFPIGGVLITPKIKASYGLLGATFGGNHLGCAAAIAVLEVIESESLMGNAKIIGEYLIDGLKDNPAIKEIRGKGLMVGIELDDTNKNGGLKDDLLFKEHIFIGSSGKNIIRILPPLNITKMDADRFIQAFNKLIIK